MTMSKNSHLGKNLDRYANEERELNDIENLTLERTHKYTECNNKLIIKNILKEIWENDKYWFKKI